jgi:hypothetical protein
LMIILNVAISKFMFNADSNSNQWLY